MFFFIPLSENGLKWFVRTCVEQIYDATRHRGIASALPVSPPWPIRLRYQKLNFRILRNVLKDGAYRGISLSELGLAEVGALALPSEIESYVVIYGRRNARGEREKAEKRSTLPVSLLGWRCFSCLLPEEEPELSCCYGGCDGCGRPNRRGLASCCPDGGKMGFLWIRIRSTMHDALLCTYVRWVKMFVVGG